MSTVQQVGGGATGDSKIVFTRTSDGSKYTLYFDSVTDELSVTKDGVNIFSTDGVTAAFHTNVAIDPGFSYFGGQNMGQMGYIAANPTNVGTYGVIPISAPATWVPFTLFTNPASIGVRVTTETIGATSGQRFVVADAGIYMVYVYVACRVQGNSEDYLAWGFSVNGGVAQPCELVMREINNNAIISAYPMCMSFLPAGASVELQVQNMTRTNNVQVAAARFQVLRL